MRTKAYLNSVSSQQRLVLVFILVLLFSLLFYTKIFAQIQPASSASLEVSPPNQDISTDPGKSVDVKSKVSNRSNADVHIKVRIDEFRATGEQGQVELISSSENSLASWTKLDSDDFTLKAGEAKTVTASISVPPTAGGGHYGSFVFTSVPNTPQSGETAVGQEVASLFLMKLSGSVSENITVDEFSAPSFVQFGPVDLNLKFKNNGNIDDKPQGLIHITDMFGNATDVVFKGERVFPGASRVVPVTFDQKWLFGKYTATAILQYGNAKKDSLTAETSFFAFPVVPAGVVLIVLVLLFMGRKRISKAVRALGGK